MFGRLAGAITLNDNHVTAAEMVPDDLAQARHDRRVRDAARRLYACGERPWFEWLRTKFKEYPGLENDFASEAPRYARLQAAYRALGADSFPDDPEAA